MTDTRAIESFINNGGAVGEAEQSLARGNKVAQIGISAGTSVAGGLATGTGLFATGGTVATALTSAGVASSTVPVIGWIVAGVLVASAGGISLASRRRAKFLSKDRAILEKYIERYKKKSSAWRTREAKKQISMIQFLLTKKQSRYNLKRKAKAELKLEALYFIFKEERLPVLQQQKQIEAFQKISMQNRQDMLVWIPVSIGIIGLAYWYAKKTK